MTYQLPEPMGTYFDSDSCYEYNTGDYTAEQMQQAYSAGREALDKEVSALRELAAGRCTAPTVIAEIGPLSLWSKSAFDEKIADAEKRSREYAMSPLIDRLVLMGIYHKKHDTDTLLALKDMINYEIQIALDPQVSSDAQALIDRGRESMQKECIGLKLFALKILADFPELGTFDGGDIQEMAVACGLLIGKEVTEPCGEGCNCVEYADLDPEGKFLDPMTCYHKSEFLK